MVVLRSGRCYFDLKGWNLRREQYCIILYNNDKFKYFDLIKDPYIVEIEKLFDDCNWPFPKTNTSSCEYTPFRCLEIVELKIAEFIIRTKTNNNNNNLKIIQN
jgi:hypothetical protein